MQIAILGTRFGEPTIEAAGLAEFKPEFVMDMGVSAESITNTAQNSIAIMAGGAPKFTRAVLEQLPNLKTIVRLGVGVNTVDIDAATEHGIIVANVPDYATEEVSTHTISMMLATVRKLYQANQTVRAGGWGIAGLQPLFSMADQTIAIIGFGKIGQAVARKLREFNCELLVHDPFVSAEFAEKCGATLASLDDIFARADVISLNAPETPETHHLINAASLAKMKSTAIIVNTSRGGLINEADLVAALQAGKLGGAALDVLETEPARADNPLVAMPNVMITPHMSWYSVQGTLRMREFATRELVGILKGNRPKNFVNPEVMQTR